jgi:DNA-binding NarL/FixJ family response regulator
MALKKKILIVDDHDEFRKILRTFLETENKNFEISEADSETSAVKKAKQEKPDVVLLELQLPKMNGVKTSKLIKEVSSRSKIIIVTMFESEILKRKCLGAEIYDIIGKSQFDSALVATLIKHLRNRKSSNERKRSASV